MRTLSGCDHLSQSFPILSITLSKSQMNHNFMILKDLDCRTFDSAKFCYSWRNSSRGQLTIEIPCNPQRAARQATLTIRAMAVTIAVPRHDQPAPGTPPVTLNAPLVEAEAPSDGGAPMRWWLLTSLPIATFEQAGQCVRWYPKITPPNHPRSGRLSAGLLNSVDSSRVKAMVNPA
jgi:hypothetical protein